MSIYLNMKVLLWISFDYSRTNAIFVKKIIYKVPPNEPRIFDTHGKEITVIAGPFREGQEFFLACQVSGGNPPPKVSWWRSNIEIPGTSYQSIETGAVINNLLMRAIPRDYYGTKLRCKAQGSPLIASIEKEVTVQLHCKNMLCSPFPHKIQYVFYLFSLKCVHSETSQS